MIILKILLTLVAAVLIPGIVMFVFVSAFNVLFNSSIASLASIILALVVVAGGIVLWAMWFGLLAILFGLIALPVAIISFGFCIEN